MGTNGLGTNGLGANSLDWQAAVQFLAGGCVVLFSLCAVAELAWAQYVPAPTPLPPPVFNPSSPYTVPQPSYRPIAPATPNAGPANVAGAPLESPLTTVRPHRRTAAVKTSPAKTQVAERRFAKSYRVHRSRAIAVAPAPSYYAPVGYGCAWHRSWDGYWFRTSPCS